MKNVVLAILIAVLLVLLSLPSVVATENDDAGVIRKVTQDWIDVSATGDIDTYLSLITDDFIWLGDFRGPGYSGHEEVRAFLEPYFETTNFSLENWTSDEIVFSGDRQQAVHFWSGVAVAVQKDGSGKSEQSRKYVDFWIKSTDGKWRCSRHLYVVLK